MRLLYPSRCPIVAHECGPVSVESEGPYIPPRLLPEAIGVMKKKIEQLKKAAEELLDDGLGEPKDIEMEDA